MIQLHNANYSREETGDAWGNKELPAEVFVPNAGLDKSQKQMSGNGQTVSRYSAIQTQQQRPEENEKKNSTELTFWEGGLK